jgi:hypothetical protein
MRSTMRLHGSHLVETLGAARLTFELLEEAGALVMQVRSMRFLGLWCPRWLWPRITAREHGRDGQLHFQVSAGLPLVGRVVAYTGHLDVANCEGGDR